MKKITLLLISICCTLGLMAEPIGKQAALYTAQSYLLAKGKVVSNASRPVWTTRKGVAQQQDDGNAYYYVFNVDDNGGYVIVSGDDRTEPILGYVEQGTFDPDNMPENMRSWLQSYADQIKFIVDNDIQLDSPLLKKRNKVRGTKHSVPELLTTRWDQGHPYNLTCPKYYRGDGSQDFPATGCTATAMAQVINHYKYPDKTKAEIPALTNEYTLDNGSKMSSTAPAIPKGTRIDWENMRDTYHCYDGHAHDATEYAVANLMLYCGQAVNMGYGASSAANFDAWVFTKYFGFDDSAFVGERGDYSIDQWFDLLYGELEQGYPILFSGFSSGGGHAFVIDGFDGDNLFHLNWGWSGGSNGWFLIGILNPDDNSGIGASSSSDGYSMGQRALCSLRLPDNIPSEPTTALTVNDVAINGTSIFGNYINWTGSTNSFNAAIVKLDDDGSLSPVGNVESINNLGDCYYVGLTFDLRGKLPQGTYKLSPASKLNSASTWRTKYNMRDEYIEAVVNANGVPSLRHVTPVENISIEAIEFMDSRIVGNEQEVKVTFRNNGDEYYREVHFFASKTNNKVYTDNRSMVAVRKGETVEVSYFFTPNETGTYNLWFCTGSDGSGQVGTGTMEIIEESQAAKANLAVTSFTVNNAIGSNIYGKRLVGKVNVKNNASTDFNGSIRFQIWTYKDGDEYVYTGPSLTSSVNIPAGKTTTVQFDFNNLSEGLTYYLPLYYVGQDGELSGAGIWDHSWKMAEGIITWQNSGTAVAKAYSSTLAAASDICGLYAECSNFTRLTPNSNANTIYAFSSNMQVPTSLNGYNTVKGNHASAIRLVNDKPFYVPVSFEADEATFTYTFPSTETGTGWHTFTLPFKPTSIKIGNNPVSLDDALNHFWIYEFAAQGDNGEVIFAPATELRRGTPYIIAADATMANRSITFSANNVSFFETGSDKMVVSSQHYKFYGTSLSPLVKDCYALNSAGTAFEYATTYRTVKGLNTYFTTTLAEGQRLSSIQLPAVPSKAALSLSEHNIELVPGEELQLRVNTLNTSLQWTSSNERVASVSSQGLVTAKALGKAKVIVTDPTDETQTDTCLVTVLKEHPGHRYYQFAIEATKSNNQIQLSEFDLIDADGNEVRPLTTYYYTGNSFNTNESQPMLFDDDINTKYGGSFTQGQTLYIYIDAGERVVLSGYRLTTANDTQAFSGRNPTSWSIYGSNTKSQSPNDDVWTLLDHRQNDNTLEAENYKAYDFPITYPQEVLMGDVNDNGEVDLSDAIMVTYYSLHVAPAGFNEAAADMNGDGEIDLSDAIIIIYKSLGVTE